VNSKRRIPLLLLALSVVMMGAVRGARADEPPQVVRIDLDDMVNQITAQYIVRGIDHANQENASAVLLVLNTPGGLLTSMREIVQAIFQSRVPVITYVAPSGADAASAGFFILLAGDVVAMAPGTTSGAAHPVYLLPTGGEDKGKSTMDEKIENDVAAYIRSITQKRGRNSEMAEAGVRQSKSYTDKEMLDGHLADLIAKDPQDIFAQMDGKTIKRFDGSTTTLRLKGAMIEALAMTRSQRFFAWVANPNIAFIFGAIGLVCLYFEFTHPGAIAPGVAGAICIVLALYAFNMVPLNAIGIVLILLAITLFIIEAKVTTHGILAAGGLIAMVLGAMMLVNSPWPEARIHFTTALSVALPLAIITVILLRLAVQAYRRKTETGEPGMIGALGTVQVDLDPQGKVFVHGEIWSARSVQTIPAGSRVKVLEVDGLTLVVEPAANSR
jgi:membrane-bound serine protease (ClpP class)